MHQRFVFKGKFTSFNSRRATAVLRAMPPAWSEVCAARTSQPLQSLLTPMYAMGAILVRLETRLCCCFKRHFVRRGDSVSLTFVCRRYSSQ